MLLCSKVLYVLGGGGTITDATSTKRWIIHFLSEAALHQLCQRPHQGESFKMTVAVSDRFLWDQPTHSWAVYGTVTL